MQNIKDQLNTVVKLFNSGEKQKAFEKINLLINYISKSLVAESWVRPEVWFFTNSYSLTMFYFKLSKLKFLTKLIHFSTPEVYGDTKNKISENNFFFGLPLNLMLLDLKRYIFVKIYLTSYFLDH